MSLKDIISNAKYADDMVLTLPDGTTATIGEMRGYTASERQSLLARNSSLEEAEGALRTRVVRLQEAGLLDSNLNPVVPTSQQTSKASFSAMSGVDENDPLFGPMYKQFRTEIAEVTKSVKDEIAGLQTSLKQIGSVTQQAVKGYLGDHYDATFRAAKSSLPEALRDKYTLDKVVEYATNKRLTDSVGRLDISMALDQLSWEDRKATFEAEQAKTREQLETDRKAIAQMGRPQMAGPKHNSSFKGIDDKGKTLSLDDALAAAQNDSEIWNSIGATASGVVN